MTTLSSAITRIETIIEGDSTHNGVYGRTDLGPGMSGTFLDGWSVTQGDIAGVTVSADSLGGKHVVASGVARRITANSITSATGATSITTLAFDAAPVSGATYDIREGFTRCPTSQRLERNVQDRWFQVRVKAEQRLEGFGNGQDRVQVDLDVLVAYIAAFKGDEVALRASEDCAAIRAQVTDRSKMVAGVNVFGNGDAGIHWQDDNGRSVIWSFPLRIIYYRTRKES